MKEYKPSEELIQMTIQTYMKEGNRITEAEEIVRTLASFGEILLEWYGKLPPQEKEDLLERSREQSDRVTLKSGKKKERVTVQKLRRVGDGLREITDFRKADFSGYLDSTTWRSLEDISISNIRLKKRGTVCRQSSGGEEL